ncbi:acyltransferase family protein [Streptomyces gobiensis]|uniref:acyltransferase family protein n=1 Tax=Streptomyces gobiensis TaxID=2875706 RepID=UPI001E58BDC3|nr:acyltransferase family protein [Streptomyces gobiensis]UGY91421.1 acyltransferase family protein [Streptomyces gobiensis]
MFHAGYERAPLPPARPETPEATTPTRSPEPPAASGGASRDKRRDPFFDNAKYLTILLVGIGHAWEPLRSDSRAAVALYIAVYAFHMPAFIIISGYLSRSFEGRPSQLKRLITGVAVPYLVFEVIYTLFMRWLAEPDRSFALLSPSWGLWFLVALFIWRLTTPLWNTLRWPLPVALGIAVLASITPKIGGDLNLQRVLQFLPFFVLGLQLRPAHFDMLRHRALRIAALPVMVCALIFAYWAAPRMNHSWFFHKYSAQDLGVPWWVGVVMTFALFGCALVLTACFFVWTPRRTMWFTSLGAGTLYGYLLHFYPLRLARELGWYDMGWVDSPLSRVIITLLAMVMMTVLCTALVQRVFRIVMEPKMEWAFKTDSVAEARKRVTRG